AAGGERQHQRDVAIGVCRLGAGAARPANAGSHHCAKAEMAQCSSRNAHESKPPKSFELFFLNLSAAALRAACREGYLGGMKNTKGQAAGPGPPRRSFPASGRDR